MPEDRDRPVDVLVRYTPGWGLGDLLCSDPMMPGLVERHGPGTRIFVEGPAGNVVHNPLVAGPPPPALEPDHVVDVVLFRYMSPEDYARLEAMPSLIDHMCSYAGVTPSDRRPRLHLGPGERALADHFRRRRLPGPRVALCSDHLDPLRHWPVERWREVARALVDGGATVVEVGLKDRTGVGIDLVGQLDVRQSAAVVGTCDLYLGNNSGLFHYAQAAGTPCVTLFSLATPSRFVHPGAVVHPVQADLPCIDCMTRAFVTMQRTGCIAAPRGRCMLDIGVDRVLTTVERALEGANPPCMTSEPS